MHRIFYSVNCFRRIHLFMDAVHWSVMQYLRKSHRKPYNNNYIYSYRYQCNRMHKHSYCNC